MRLIAIIFVLLFADVAFAKPLYTYTLKLNGGEAAYDEAVAVASLQGIINRDSPKLYVLSPTNSRPQYWLNVLAENGRWLHGRKQTPLPDLGAVIKLAGSKLKGAVIWDPAVPATLNVATTIAGVRDGLVLSPELAARWHLPVLEDLRGKFTGAETGSKKNDAYRWAIRQYLTNELCSAHLLCLFEDSFSTRARGDIGYAITRDWAVKNRAFVFDLSPWGDEKPGDDPGQRMGTDLETYKMILAETLRHSAGKEMTELNGFFALSKYSHMPDHPSVHEGVPTEWESVWLISPYNCYQNTITENCFNQSLHSHAPRKPLKQVSVAKPVRLENKTYVCFFMSDYDSATPLYDFLPKFWQSPDRGKIPLAWGINPSQLEAYPDLIAYFYSTASPEDTFTSDASAAGYINPNHIAKEYLPLFVRHNQKFFREADMRIAPMVLDRGQPTPEVKDAFRQFAPDGYATIVIDANPPAPEVWKGMPIMELLNDMCNSKDSGEIAGIMARYLQGRNPKTPGFCLFRTVWIDPAVIIKAMAQVHQTRPELNFEVIGPREFFRLYKEYFDHGSGGN